MKQRDRMKCAVPEPLKGIRGRRGAHEVVTLARPRRSSALTIAFQAATGVGRDLVPFGAHDSGLSDARLGYDAKPAPARLARQGGSMEDGETTALSRRAFLSANDATGGVLTTRLAGPPRASWTEAAPPPPLLRAAARSPRPSPARLRSRIRTSLVR